MKHVRIVNSMVIEIFNVPPKFHPDIMATIVEAPDTVTEGQVYDGSTFADYDTTEPAIREAKKAEIKAQGLSRIQAQLPDIDTIEELETLRKFAPAFSLSAAGTAARDIYLYARAKLDQADTALIAEVQAYDPTTDPGWPS